MHNTSKIKKVIPRHHLYASHLRTKAKRSKDVNGISSGYQLSTYDILGDHSKSGASWVAILYQRKLKTQQPAFLNGLLFRRLF
jgi:hypothetical protein